MKILIPVDPEIPVPPRLYGGVERLVDGLIMAYAKEGHEVVLVAHEDSTNKLAKLYAWPAKHSRGLLNSIQNTRKLYSVVNQEKPDVIHSFGRLVYMLPEMIFKKIPLVMTYGRAISIKTTGMSSKIAGDKLQFTCCGEHMLKQLPDVKKFTPIHNFTLTDYFVPNKNVSKDFLMFLGRIEDIKGTKEAIDVAIATNQKLLIAGNIQEGHDDYFENYIKPYLDNPLIEYVGPVNDEQKLHYLQRAKAFLFPIKWEEPFGIVLAEAMACGVPVIGFRRGSVPEVVKDGVTGYVVDNVEQMIKAVENINAINRDIVRKDCEDRFSLEFISGEYLKLFKRMLEN
ncbi:glycosyltransferase [Mangrovimonas sp. YM274]|uniref:glycosyltransferase n=1 Tax=Mangrovimonas sp. YM274 TaxID=3070660 RepID=UPI0027DB290A|nr:glycosyltransferase [Mangrovimonas sp. YM274]WMI68449.1 glycosyltransferase [Mangrovimonas sp. YM274]